MEYTRTDAFLWYFPVEICPDQTFRGNCNIEDPDE